MARLHIAKELRRPARSSQRMSLPASSVTAETTKKQTRSFVQNSASSAKARTAAPVSKNARSARLEGQEQAVTEEMDDERTGEELLEPLSSSRNSKRPAQALKQDARLAKRQKTRNIKGPNSPATNDKSQDSLIQGGFDKNAAAPEVEPEGESTEHDGEDEQSNNESDESDGGSEGTGDTIEAKARPENPNKPRSIIKVKSKSASKGSAPSQNARKAAKSARSQAVNQSETSSGDQKSWDFEEDDLNDYDGPLPKSFRSRPGMIQHPSRPFDGIVDYDAMELLEDNLYQVIPECVRALDAYWAEMDEMSLVRLQTNLAPKLKLHCAWGVVLDVVKNVPNSSRTNLQTELNRLASELNKLSLRNRWRRKSGILQDYYIFVYPCLVLITILSIAALTPLYRGVHSDSTDAYETIDCIFSFILEVKDLEYHMTNQKLGTTSHAFRRDIQKATRMPLEKLKAAFHDEVHRRKTALTKVDAQLKRKSAEELRQAERGAAIKAKREQQERARAQCQTTRSEQRTELEVHWARQEARQSSVRDREDGLSKAERLENKEYRIWQKRDIIYKRISEIIEPQNALLPARTRVKACVGDPLLVDFGMNEDDIQQWTMKMVIWQQDVCKARHWDVAKWEWVATLLDEWDLWDPELT